MENISDRLKIYMDFKGLNAHTLTIDAGLSNGMIGKAIKTKTGLHSDSIEKILNTYPDLSPEWLLTGKGEMIRDLDTKKKMEPKEDSIVVDKDLLLDMFNKVDYIFKLTLKETVDKELRELRDAILKGKKVK